MGSPYTDLDRPPLNEAALRRALITPGGLWTALDYRPTTGSTNADAATAARDGAPEGYVVTADEQTAGRGRLDRQWQSPPRAGIAVSVLLRPGDDAPGWTPVPPSGYAILPLLAGVALAEAVRRLAEVDAVLKWPNDLLIGDRKCAGILAESVVGGAVVIGIGVNVTLRSAELPRPDATSLRLAGAASYDRDPLLRALLRAFADRYTAWRDVAGDPTDLLEAYRFHCATIGRAVRVTLPAGVEVTGTADGVADDGSLVVDGRRIAAGDVVHVHAAG